MKDDIVSEKKKPEDLPPKDIRIHTQNTENDDEDILDNNTKAGNPVPGEIMDEKKEKTERSPDEDTIGNP